MENLFEEFKSGKRKESYVKHIMGDENAVFLVYLKYKNTEGLDGIVFDYTSIGLHEDSNCTLGESKDFRIRKETFSEFKEITAEQFYEAYDVYVKYQSCNSALKEIFNKL